jgi:4-amino-4-deoxy-L-arabinose transferase-like glycosyltransferase
MTRDSVRRRGARPFGPGLLSDAATLVTVLIIAGVLLRVLVGGLLLPLSGFRIDIGDFTAWAMRLADLGPGAFYETGYFSDYPPGYLYVLWLLGSVGQALQPLTAGFDITAGLVKIPGVLADAGVAWTLFAFSRRFLDGSFGSWSGERVGVVAVVVYLFNPATIFDSAVWGQVDSVGTLALLATLYWLARGWTEVAAIGAVVALLIKFQFAFVIPIVAIVGIKRHLAGRSTDPDHDGRPDPVRVLSSLAAGLGSLVLLIWPFGMTVWAPGDPNHSLIGKFTEAANTYKGLTINAFNMWRNPWSGLGDQITWGCDAPNPPGCDGGAGVAFMLGASPVSWQLVGAVLFAAVALLAFWQVARRDDAVGILESSLLLAVAFFALPTRVHERYLFPALALAAPLVARTWRSFRATPAIVTAVAGVVFVLIAYVVPLIATGARDPAANSLPFILAILAVAIAIPMTLSLWGGAALYGLLSLSVFANVYWVYTADWSFVEGPPIAPGVGGLPMVRDPFLAATVFSDWGVFAFSAMSALVLGALAIRAALAAWVPAPHPVRQASMPAPAARAAPAATPSAAEALPAGMVRDAAEQSSGPGAIERLGAWLRPDPHDSYLKEPTRRLDRLDLVLVIGFVLFAFLFRLWRLDTPRSMHFDEVYHARSATEWLTDWQEGWTRDTYEWTHPMLAKYLIAAGIVVADPNKETGSVPLESPATALAVAPQRTSFLRPATIAFTAASDATITAREVPSGEVVASWEAPGRVASLAYDEDGERLLVGLADDGDVAIYLLSIFLQESGERSPPPIGAPLETSLAAVTQIDMPSEASILLLRGPDGIAEVERVTGLELARSELRAGGIGYVPATGSGEDVTEALVVATDSARGVLVVLDAATLEPAPAFAGEAERLLPLPSPPAGPIQIRGGGDLQVWVPVGALPADEEHPAVDGGITVFDKELNLIDTAPLPGAPQLIGWQSVANIMYIAGIDSSSGGPAAWTVQPIGNGGTQSAGFAAFDTTPLPGEAQALAFDISDHDQGDDHGRLLVSVAAGAGGGELVSIDAGSNAFAWRLSGIVFGSILAGLVYLLAATMFSRRRIAVLAAAFIALDAMSYVMSRISMNDIFVATFIVAAYLLFWQIWSGRWARSAWWALPLVGVLIGLAAATKWVGIYALIGLLVLVLARSGLGRFLLVAAIAFITVVLGIGAPWPFLVVCLAALALALLVAWARPIRLDPREVYGLAPTAVVLSAIGLAFSLAYGLVPDAREARPGVEMVFGVLARGAQVAWPAWIMLGLAGALILLRAAVSLSRPATDRRWLSPAELGGLAWPWIGACLAVVPLLVYFVAYVPYLQLGHAIAGPSAGPGYGWSLDEMHAQMFGYHFGLQAGHVASSPWWSWPLDLKAVFFYTHDFDDRTTGVIYNGGNPILFWAGVPALAWCAVQAWRRRSPALVLLVVAFAFQFLPWTRIERATFQYHYLSALPFAMVAVAYVVDEMLRTWSWRPFAIAFLVLAAVAGVLVFPLGSALAMPDWYINLARALPTWNYAFVFPSPPQGERTALISADAAKAAVGALVALVAATFALFGRDLLGRWTAQRGDDQHDPQHDQADRPEPVGVDLGHVLADQEVGAEPHQDQAEDQRPAT